MAFEAMTVEQYRSMTIEQLEERRAEVQGLCLDPECDATAEQLRSEANVIAQEFIRRNAEVQLRNANIAAVASGAGTPISGMQALGAQQRSAEPTPVESDMYDTTEYRNAFMAYVQRGTAIPMELRADAHTMTTDVAPMIPTTMGREIVQKMSEYGTIWNKVRKLSVQGGLWFRVLELKPTATWIGEDAVSEYQKAEADEKISFSFFELECRMSQSLLASAVTFADFQALFVPAVAEAMVRALEQAIVRGSGNDQPLGFTVDPRITNVVEMSEADFADWKMWRKKVKAAMPKAYRNGEFLMAQSTFDSYIETMSDDQNAPVSIGYNPVTGEEQMRLMGKSVITTEPDIFPDFDTANVGDVVAVFGDLNNYLMNTQPGMPMSTTRWIDHETNKEKIKALMACDGKVLDPHGFVLIKKAEASA